MARFAVIKDGEVINVIEAPEGYQYPDKEAVLVLSEEASVEWRHDESGFIPPPPPVMEPPRVVTRRQLRLWLVRHGKNLSDVEAELAKLPEKQRVEAMIEWQDSTVFERDNPLLMKIAGTLFGLEGTMLEEALKEAFAEAATY